MKILLLLTPLFLLVAFGLIFYSRRRSQLFQEFAGKQGLAYLGDDDGSLEQLLNLALRLEPPLNRVFSQIRDIADAGGIQLFRLTEALDLSQYGLPQNAHFDRVAVSFPTSVQAEFYFLARGQREFRPVVPQSSAQIAADPSFQVVQRVLSSYPPPHPISLTLMRGRFLAYLEPAVSGAEGEPDLSYLLKMAQRIRRKL